MNHKLASRLSTFVSIIGLWLAMQAVVNVTDQLIPRTWSREVALNIMLIIAFLAWQVLTMIGSAIFVLAYKLFTGKWYVTQTPKRST